MAVLIIFDDIFDCKTITNLLKNNEKKVFLYPLSSNFLIIEKIHKQLSQIKDVQVQLINSAKEINTAVETIQNHVHEWSAQAGRKMLWGKSLKEWFLFPDQQGSAWWLGLISEKNTVQDDVFFRIAQINAIQTHFENHPYNYCFSAVTNAKLHKAIKEIGHTYKIKTGTLRSINFNFKNILSVVLANSSFLEALYSAAIQWAQWLRNYYYTRKYLPKLSKRISAQNKFLFVSYFPNINQEDIAKNQFRNKYCLALQKKLEALNIPFTWLLMPVFYNGFNFKNSMQLARNLVKNGEKLIVLQEFFTIKIFLKSINWWLRQALLSIILFYKLDHKEFCKPISSVAAFPFIKYIWWHSFIGTSGLRGIIFYLTYQSLFKRISNVENCLYFCEMQAWEKALLMANRGQCRAAKTIAFQHTVVMRNYFNYFYHESETKQYNQNTDFPLPDLLVANGQLMHDLLAKSKYPNLSQAEAIRQLYIKESLRASSLSRLAKKPILLVAGSCDKTETKSMLSMLYSAFPKPARFEIWLKGSPVNPLEPLFKELDIDIRNGHYKIFYDDISSLLKQAKIAFVANTTVAIEAIAFNCGLIIPLFADTMLMNPVIDTNVPYDMVSTVAEFKSAVLKMLKSSNNADEDSRNFIENYWNLDSTLPSWTTILLS